MSKQNKKADSLEGKLVEAAGKTVGMVTKQNKKALLLLALAVGLSKLISFILDEACQPADLSDLLSSLYADASET